MIQSTNNLFFSGIVQSKFRKPKITSEGQDEKTIYGLFQPYKDIRNLKYEKSGDQVKISGIFGKRTVSAILKPGQGNPSLKPLDIEEAGITITSLFKTHHIPQRDIDRSPVIREAVRLLENKVKLLLRFGV